MSQDHPEHFLIETFLNWPRFIGPLLTVVATVAYHAGALYFGYSISAIFLLVFLVLGSFVSGLRGGLIAAAWVSAYTFFAVPDPARNVQIMLGSFAIAAIVGGETRALRESLAETEAALRQTLEATHRAELNQHKADIVDTVNGNIKLTLEAITLLDQLRFGWAAMPDDARLKDVERARGKLADLATLTKSFRQIARERGFALGEDEDA